MYEHVARNHATRALPYARIEQTLCARAHDAAVAVLSTGGIPIRASVTASARFSSANSANGGATFCWRNGALAQR
jgi:hypothetical protein